MSFGKKHYVIRLIGATALIATLQTACGKDKKSGQALGLPQVKPPVANNTPAGIKGASLRLSDSSSPLTTLASRLFSPGPTNILDRLGQIDARLTEMDSRSKESEKKCLSNAAALWSAPTTLPGGTDFPLYFQCLDTFNSSSSDFQIAFGMQNDTAYMAEIQNSADAMKVATLVKAAKDGSSTEAWVTMEGFDSSQTGAAGQFFFLAIKGDNSSKGFEVAVGGTGPGIGVDCGVQVRSDGTTVYAKGIFASFGDRGAEDCSGTGAGEKDATLCVDAASLTAVDAANCADIDTFTLPTLTHTGLAASGLATADALVGAKITGFTAFSESK